MYCKSFLRNLFTSPPGGKSHVISAIGSSLILILNAKCAVVPPLIKVAAIPVDATHMTGVPSNFNFSANVFKRNDFPLPAADASRNIVFDRFGFSTSSNACF
ncbi:unnamed protein product [Ambrosiozyma monospora]|uniref:Unnamed protein product n=1 Tax=Ambrosiozyma monospora TaxID=43982 RepID=A0A9W6YU39_AMBMO|nr:unnamed protein product [Ambrosiozyma monospora]